MSSPTSAIWIALRRVRGDPRWSRRSGHRRVPAHGPARLGRGGFLSRRRCRRRQGRHRRTGGRHRLRTVPVAHRALLRIFAPIASLLVQAAVSRQREFLADATSVELTRNPAALARALGALREDRDPIDYANRGSQHLWFSNPVRHRIGSGTSWLATHPSLDDRIARLQRPLPSGRRDARSRHRGRRGAHRSGDIPPCAMTGGCPLSG